jgi:thiamine-monophosphate kinase
MRFSSDPSPRKAGTAELALLQQIRARAARPGSNALTLGIGDDCALLQLRRGEEAAVTTDLSIAGRHFRLDWHPPESIGHRTLARGLSDLAAMGARPVAAFLSLGLPAELTKSRGKTTPFSRQSTYSHLPWIDAFLGGLVALADTHRTTLAGGDLAESPLPVADIVLVGAVRRGRALLRSAARPGDLVYVTGSLGGAAAALQLLSDMAANPRPAPSNLKRLRIPGRIQAQLAPHLFPQPRIAQGLYLVRHGLGAAAIDLSDGLSTDLAHICEESDVSAEIDSSLLPIHPTATLEQALNGGEDYELLFTAKPSSRIPRSIAGVRITHIGRILRSGPNRPAITLLTPTGPQSLQASGWQHFS